MAAQQPLLPTHEPSAHVAAEAPAAKTSVRSVASEGDSIPVSQTQSSSNEKVNTSNEEVQTDRYMRTVYPRWSWSSLVRLHVERVARAEAPPPGATACSRLQGFKGISYQEPVWSNHPTKEAVVPRLV